VFHRIAHPRTIGIGLSVILALVVGLHAATVAKAGGISLRPPYTGTYRLTSFFDHHYPNYGHDNEITIYTGESVADCSPHCYEGHPGYDWAMNTGTQVLAAADGIVRERFESNVLYGNSIAIEHDNGYYTLYAHLRDPNPFNVVVGQRVAAGDVIGWSGNTGNSTGPHLHFGVYRGPFTRVTNDERYATDPFGWRGSYADPLLNRPAPGDRHTATCLWRSSDEDPVSCADTIVEDGGRGFNKAGTWYTSTLGNGYHMYYAPTTNVWNWSIYSEWVITPSVSGPYKLFAYVPSQFATTKQARYWIYSVDCPLYCEKLLDQSAYTDTWAFLGTYTLPVGAQGGHVFLYVNTGESPAKQAGADAIKFRTYTVFLPAILKDYP